MLITPSGTHCVFHHSFTNLLLKLSSVQGPYDYSSDTLNQWQVPTIYWRENEENVKMSSENSMWCTVVLFNAPSYNNCKIFSIFDSSWTRHWIWTPLILVKFFSYCPLNIRYMTKVSVEEEIGEPYLLVLVHKWLPFFQCLYKIWNQTKTRLRLQDRCA